MRQQFDVFVAQAPSALAENWGRHVALGLGLAVRGLLAIWRARAAILVHVVRLGTLAIAVAVAVAVLVVALSFTGYWTGFFIHVLWAIPLARRRPICHRRPAELDARRVSSRRLSRRRLVGDWALRLDGKIDAVGAPGRSMVRTPVVGNLVRCKGKHAFLSSA